MAELSTFSSVQSNLLVRVEVEYYRNSPTGTPTSTVLLFSDLNEDYEYLGETYQGLGRLMGVTTSSSELRPSSGELSISISGIPNASIAEIVYSRMKGCPVRIYRVLKDPTTGSDLELDQNPLARYRGFVSNYSLQEEYDIATRTATNTIVLVCNSSIDVLQNKYAGRKTNPVSQKEFFPSDLSMDRVPNLENATFDFGAPK